MHFLGYETFMIRTTDTSIHTDGNTIAAQKISDLKERVRIVNETQGAVLISIHQNIFADSRYNGAQVFYGEDAQSKRLATNMQKAFTSSLNIGSKRISKKARGVYLMEHINVCGVLIECGFLSNRIECDLLCSEEYQNSLCEVMSRAIFSFLEGHNT
jgi:N-acetylmuramoyl-L-alanine amidase